MKMVLKRNDQLDCGSSAVKSAKQSGPLRIWYGTRRWRLSNVFPILASLRHYTWRTLFLDCFAGLTVGLTHIPQSMGTGMAANLGPMYGIYMTFFPGLIYALFGSSFHNSVGAFAPSAALVGVSVARIRAIFAGKFLPNQTVEIVREADFPAVSLQHLEIAVTITLMAGFMQLALAFWRLEFLTRIFSHTVLDPFNCACSLQIMLVQIPNMLGVNLNMYYGLNKHIGVLALLFNNIGRVRWIDTLLSIITASVIIAFRDFIQPKLFKWIRLVIPIEFILIAAFTGISYGLNLHDNYGVRILGNMAVGIPAPKIPVLRRFMPYVVFEGLLSALLAIAFNMQATRPAARKHGYRVSSTQELVALGAANVFSSFFSCFVSSANIGRISIQESMGARSQIVTLVGCLLTGLLLAFASQTLYYLPSGVIAAVITLTLSMSLKLFEDLPNIWRSCKLDAIQWITTFSSCVLLDLEWGLLIGLCFSWIRLQHQVDEPHLQSLGPHEEAVLQREATEKRAVFPAATHDFSKTPCVRVLRMGQSLNYANAEKFIRRVLLVADHRVPVSDTRKASACTRVALPGGPSRRNTIHSQMDASIPEKSNGTVTGGVERNRETSVVFDSAMEDTAVKHLIIDWASLKYIDSAGIRAVIYLTAGLTKRHVTLWLADCSDPIKHIVTRCVAALPVDQIVPSVNHALTEITMQRVSLVTSDQLRNCQGELDSTVHHATAETQFWQTTGIPESERLDIELQEPTDPDDLSYQQSSRLDDRELQELNDGETCDPCRVDESKISYSDNGLWLVNGANVSPLANGHCQGNIESASGSDFYEGVTKF